MQQKKIIIFSFVVILFSASIAFASIPLFQTPQNFKLISDSTRNLILDDHLKAEADSEVSSVSLNYQAWHKIQTSA